MDSVALIGTGVMGSALVRRLIELGLQVRVYNRTRAKCDALRGPQVTVCDSPAEAVQGAALAVTALADTAALRQVVEGASGVLAAARAPCFAVIDIGTHRPAELVPLARGWAARGLTYIEAPVTGNIHDALHGRLNFLAGGHPVAVEAARPFLESLGQRVHHFGPVGSGNMAKLAFSLVSGSMVWALAQATALLDAERLDLAAFHDVLAVSVLASPLFQRLGQRSLSCDFEPGFALSHLQRDLEAARSESTRLGLRGRQVQLLCEVLGELAPALGARDIAALLAVPDAAGAPAADAA